MPDCAVVGVSVESVTLVTDSKLFTVPVVLILPLVSTSRLVVIAPVVEFLVICSKPPSDLTGPLNVVSVSYTHLTLPTKA